MLAQLVQCRTVGARLYQEVPVKSIAHVFVRLHKSFRARLQTRRATNAF
jgi:hypothetical protein